MCVGTPMQIVSINGIAAKTTNGRQSELIDLSLTPDARIGDWVLTFLGTAREILAAEEARKISAALEGLRSVMEGGAVGDAFADIDERGPQLPAHLQAALDAGAETG